MRSATLVTIACVLGSVGGRAAELTWDAVPGSGQAEDGGGVWSSSPANTHWWNQIQNVSWPDTTADRAIFGVNSGAAGVVSVSGTVAAGGLVFTNAGSGMYELSGGTITLGGVAPELNAVTNAMIKTDLAGSAGLVKTGAGILTLEGAKSYSGATVVSGGVLAVKAPWAPPTTNGLLVWLDADDATTLVLDSSNRVSAWASKGSYTGSATASGTDRPQFAYSVLNGHSVVRFDDTQSNRMDNVGALTAANFAASNASMFVVWTINNDIWYDVVCTAGATEEYWRWKDDGHPFFSMFRAGRVTWWTQQLLPGTMPTTGAHMLDLTMSATDSAYKIWMDGVPWYNIANSTFALQATLQLGYSGSGTYLNGDIAEVLIYTNVLSEAERLQVDAYLNAKWLGIGSGASTGSDMLPTNTAVRVGLGATLDLSPCANQRIASLSNGDNGGGAVRVGGGATLTVGDANNSVFSGSISGAGGLTKTGPGTLSLTGTNGYAGVTTIATGTLSFSHADLRGGAVNYGTLAFTIDGDGACGGVISGGGSLVKQGGGNLSFAADQTYTGPTVVNAGKLLLGAPGAPVSSGLLVWLDAADAATISKDGGDLVGAWASKGSYTGSVTSAGTSRPTFTAGGLNGKSVVRFTEALANKMDNVGALTTANFAQSNASVFVVWALNGDLQYGVVSTAAAGDEYWRIDNPNGNTCISVFRNGRISGWSDAPALHMPTTGAHVLDLITAQTSSTYQIWLDGAPVVNTNAIWGIQPTLQLGYGTTGANTYLNGDIAEVLIYTNALSEAERLKVQAYLNAKWGLGLTMRGEGVALAGCPQITVASGATLDLAGATNAMLNTNALLSLSGVLNLEAGSTQTVRRLILNSENAANGTWGGTGSGASRINPTFFTGTGVLNVTDAVCGTILSIR